MRVGAKSIHSRVCTMWTMSIFQHEKKKFKRKVHAENETTTTTTASSQKHINRIHDCLFTRHVSRLRFIYPTITTTTQYRVCSQYDFWECGFYTWLFALTNIQHWHVNKHWLGHTVWTNFFKRTTKIWQILNIKLHLRVCILHKIHLYLYLHRSPCISFSMLGSTDNKNKSEDSRHPTRMILGK